MVAAPHSVARKATPVRRQPVPKLLAGRLRLLAAAFAALSGILLTWHLPREMRLVISFDLATLAYVLIFFQLMRVATPQQAADISHGQEPRGVTVLFGVVLLSFVSFSIVAAMLDNMNGASHLLRIIHLSTSLLAIILAWLLAHIIFGLHYMSMYYNDLTVTDAVSYDEGLAYPDQKTPDYWDFMYYSFTIAMCYQTSDVTITNPAIRRVTLLHAIFSFLFVALIIGLVVNVLSNIT
jgi:uncharacterized membrane protein